VTAVEIIEQIKRLPTAERNKVIKFAREAEDGRRLSPAELGELSKQMVEATDPAEADRLQEKIINGFYGKPPHA